MKNAGAIIRVSSPGQKYNTSPETQLIEIKRACEEHGFMLNEQHIWFFAESGKRAMEQRQGLDRARRAVQNGEIQRLYVYNVKRLSRNMTSGLLFIEELTAHGCEIFNIATNRILSRYDLSFLIELMLAERDGIDIINETYKGLKKSVRDGKYSGGIVAYGYSLNPRTHKLEINEEEATVVRLIYHLCVNEHMSCKKIADYLNARGFKTKYELMPNPVGKRQKTTGLWGYGRIRNMIVNTAYKGVWQWGKRSTRPDRELIDSTCPAIVSEEMWNAAQVELQRNRLFDPVTTVKRKYLLRGLIKCEECGHTFSGYYSRISGGRERRYYRCNGKTQAVRLNQTPCHSPSLPADTIEDVVWNDVYEYCRHPKTILRNLVLQRDKIQQTEIHNELVEIEKALKERDLQLKNFILLQSKSTHLSVRDIDEMAKMVEQEKAVLSARKARLLSELETWNQIDKNLSEFETWLTQIQKRLDNPTWYDKREIIVNLVEKIIVGYVVNDDVERPHVDVFYRFQRPEYISGDSVIMTLTGKREIIYNGILISMNWLVYI